LTWFRKDKDMHWLEADSEDVVLDIVKQADENIVKI